MLELFTSYTFSQVPIITYDALDEYAEAVLRDAAPDALQAGADRYGRYPHKNDGGRPGGRRPSPADL